MRRGPFRGHHNSPQEVYFGPVKVRDVHATFWHEDHLQKPDIPEGWGYTLFAKAQIGDVVPFLRYGKSEDTSRGNPALLDKMIAGGIGLTNVFGQNNDLIWVGLSWGRSELVRPGDSQKVDLTGDGSEIVDQADVARALVREEQYTGEIFYRIQLTNELQVTPHVQPTWNPILNVEESFTTVLGVRGRAEW